jgi:hypothetical protein
MISARISAQENKLQKCQDQAHINMKTLYLNMDQNNSQAMDLVQD